MTNSQKHCITLSHCVLPSGFLLPPQLTSQDRTRQVIERALEKHNMEDSSCHDFNLFQMLNNGKGEFDLVRLFLKQYNVWMENILITGLTLQALFLFCVHTCVQELVIKY